jgi:hypothetical protein
MKNINDLKKIAINSAFAVEIVKTKAKNFNNDEEMKNEFFISGEKLAKNIFVNEVLVETNYNKNELKDFIKDNKDFFKFDEEKIENFSYKDMVKVVNNSTENIIDFGNDVKPLFERTFTEYSEDTLKECEQDYFESLGRKKLLPILLKEIEENVEHFKEVKGFMINDVDNEFGREDDYYQFRDKLMKDVSNEFYNTFVTSVFNLDYKVEKEDKKEEKEKLIEFFGVNPLLANDFFKFISSNKIDENLFDELYDKLEDVMDKTITQEDGKQIEFVSPYEIDKNGKLSFDIKREKVDLKEIKEELYEEITKSIIKNLKSNYGDYAFSTYEFLNDNVLDKYSIGELTDRTSKEKTYKIIYKEDLEDEVLHRLTGYSINDYPENEKNTDLKLYITDVKENNETSKELLEIYQENKNKSNEEITQKIVEYLEKKDIFHQNIEISEKGLEKATNFENAIHLLEANLKQVDLGFGDKTSYSGTMYQVNGENYFNINFKEKGNKEEVNIEAKTLNDLKEKVIDFVGKDIENNKTNSEYMQKIRKENFEKLKELDLKNLEIETDKNFSFEFTNKNRDNDKYSYLLIMETEKAKHLTVNFGNDDFKNIAYALTDKNYSEVFYKEYLRYGSFSYDKIDYLKEKNVEIIKKVDENKQKETFQEIKADIIMSAMEINGRRQYLEKSEDDYVTRFLKGIDECFEDRIGTLKDKEEFIAKRHEELGLTLNSNGKISELYSPDESEYKDNINTFLDNIKENIKEEIGNRFDFDLSEEINNINKKLGKEYFENAKENLYTNEKKKAIDLIKKEYLPIRPQTMSLQKEFLRNAIPILLSEDKMGLTKKEMEELKNISDDKKEELKEKVNNYFNSYSEQAKDTKNDFVFKWNINNFYLSDYDSYSKELDIKIPKGKTVKKEVKKNIEVEKEMDI